MTIYIEYFLIQNILINYCLLRLIYLTTKNKTSFFKLLFSSTIGASFSVVSAVLLTNQNALNVLKIVCAFTMLSLAFKQTKKQFVFNFILLFLYTFAFSGAVTFISSNMYLTSFGAIMTSQFSLEAITITIIAITYIFELVSKHLKYHLQANKLIFKTTLFFNNKKLKINAYLDTGNLLEHNGFPVMILDFNSYLNLTNNDLASFFSASGVSANTVSGANNLKLFKIDKIEIEQGKQKKQINNQFIAVSTNKFNTNKYQALLSPNMF